MLQFWFLPGFKALHQLLWLLKSPCLLSVYFCHLLSVYLCQALGSTFTKFWRLYLISFNPNGIESCYPHFIDAETEDREVQEQCKWTRPATGEYRPPMLVPWFQPCILTHYVTFSKDSKVRMSFTFWTIKEQAHVLPIYWLRESNSSQNSMLPWTLLTYRFFREFSYCQTHNTHTHTTEP